MVRCSSDRYKQFESTPGDWNFVSLNLIPTETSLQTILEDPTYGIYDKVM